MEHSAILLTFIKLPFVIKIFFVYFCVAVYTGVTVGNAKNVILTCQPRCANTFFSEIRGSIEVEFHMGYGLA